MFYLSIPYHGIESRLPETYEDLNAAKIAADVCLAEKKVSFAKVKVTKSGAVKGLKSASATISLSRVKEGL